MLTLKGIFLIVSVVFFVMDAFVTTEKAKLFSLGMACFVASFLFG